MTFTRPQLLACLVLRKFYKTDYRGITAILHDNSGLRHVLDLARVPHFTTLQKAAARLLSQPIFRVLLRRTIRRVMRRRKTVRRAAADSSGFACGHASRYYIKRRSTGQGADETPSQSTFYTRYAKLETVFDTATHLAIGALTSKGPAPDVDRFVPLLDEANLQVTIKTICADAGYDSEFNHIVARQGCKIRSLMPAKHGRPSAKPPTGHWRRKMHRQLSTKAQRKRSGYTQRAQAETGYSMIKRRQGESVAARQFATQCDELRLMILTHNLMIRRVWWAFLQSRSEAIYFSTSSPSCRFTGRPTGRRELSIPRSLAGVRVHALVP
jgi:transposase